MAARLVSTRGRMRSDDELKVQRNVVFIEDEVEATDLTGSLFSAQVIDGNDKDDIHAGRTRLDRVRRMIDILLLRGHCAFSELIISLEIAGYQHVANLLKETDDEVFGEDTCNERAKSGYTSENRLDKIENAWGILSRRVTRIEGKIDVNADIPQNEIILIKEELEVVKSDCLQQINDLMIANSNKEKKIEELSFEIDNKSMKLHKAQKKIETLEKRIISLEQENARSKEEINSLHKKIDDYNSSVMVQDIRLDEQEHQLFSQVRKMMFQDKKIKDQEKSLVDLRKKDDEKQLQLEYQNLQSEEQNSMMKDLIHRVNKLADNVNNAADGKPTSPFCVNGNSLRNSNLRSHVNRNKAPIVPRNRFEKLSKF